MAGRLAFVNVGSQTAGNLEIAANRIKLNNFGGITAQTFEGGQGNIELRSQTLVLANNGYITTTTGGRGNGGNLKIDSDILAISNSAITANAFEGRGGNIQIDTQGLFFSPDSTISASSQLGINGTVQINRLDTEPSRAAIAPPAIPQTPVVTSVCQGQSSTGASQFVITGTGGIPSSPNDSLSSHAGWYDNSLPAGATENSRELELSTQDEPTQLVEE